MIDYIPNFSKLPKRFVVLEILWKRGASSSDWTNRLPTEYVETFPIYHDRLYTDLMKAETKVAALKETWEDNKGQESPPSKNVLVFIPDGLIKAGPEILEHVLVRFLTALYPFHRRRVILTHEANEPLVGFERILTLLDTLHSAKDMVMTPANIGFPVAMGKKIIKLIGSGVRTHFYQVGDLKKKKFGLLLAVGESAKNPPCMVVMDRPATASGSASATKTLCLVGKGITFDSGGLSIKSVEGMADMKYDKIGAVYAAHVYKLLVADPAFRHHRLVGIFPFAENAVSDRAVHFGDVVRGYGGKTVEITDPDGEGRLILADAFALAEEYKPDVLLDIATLTGHADTINAWSHGYAYCEPESLRFKLEKWSQAIGERMLTMPTWPEYATVLKSDMADLVNCPRDNDDAFTAALFLRQFLPASVRTWVHIDLAHEFDDHVPRGNGIRTLHRLCHELI